MEEANVAADQALAAQKSKFNGLLEEANEEIEAVKKAKAKSDKDKAGLAGELEEATGALETAKKHLAAVAEAGRKKREAQVPVNLVTGLAATTYINPFFGHHLAVAPVTSPFTAYPNGALVPEEPADVAEARAT